MPDSTTSKYERRQECPSRPFPDSFLLAYSAEHVVYEFDMFIWLAQICGNPRINIGAPIAEDAARLNNMMVESFAVHVRNVIDFLYLDNPKPTDVVAADFFDSSEWSKIRPAISPTLTAARTRANKEIAHLTTDRIAGNPPEKEWSSGALLSELKPLLQLFAAAASATRCSPVLKTFFSIKAG